MCGFCGIVGPVERAALRDVEPMARLLAHRGPDDFGTWSTTFQEGDRGYGVALGHTRLAILDLSPAGRQPMHSDDESVTLAFNGEIYNFRELRTELVRRGYRFRSHTDTEVLLQAYREWDLGALDRLIGMFAFALWDRTRRRLVLVRDRLGIKPLYYQFADDLLLFASELHAIRRHPRFRPEIDRGALGRYLRCGYVAGEETIYAGTRRLAPGGLVVWEAGRIETHRYWDLTSAQDSPVPGRFEDAVDTLEGLLGDAVERRLIADVPLGAFLSGGVDSSTVVALMQERSSRPVRTFSIGFREKEFDEAPYARAVAEHLATDHVELYVDWKQAREVAHELPQLYDEPFADSSAIPTVLLSRLTREHVTVALSGDGGDELFGGYDTYRKLARLVPWLRLPRPARALLARSAGLVPVRPIRNALRHLVARNAVELAQRLNTHFDEDALRASVGEDGARPSQVFREAFGRVAARDEVSRLRYADAATYLPEDILTKVDRASMSVGLEARVPILDHQVVQFALNLPREIYWRGGVTKAPLRAVLYRRVPKALIERPKHGFGIPIHTLLARELRDWTVRYLSPQRLAEEGNLDPTGTARLLAAAQGNDQIATIRLWSLLCFQRWFARTHRGERDV